MEYFISGSIQNFMKIEWSFFFLFIDSRAKRKRYWWKRLMKDQRSFKLTSRYGSKVWSKDIHGFIAPFVKIGRSFQDYFRHRSRTYHFRCSRHRGSWYNGITRAYRLNISPISMSSSVSSVENLRRSSRYIIGDVI